jgi:phenylalanyl-tRNA synthetase beta chain
MPGAATRIAAPTETLVSEEELRAQLVARGYFEAVNFAFVDAATLARWDADAAAVALANPLSAELAVMRTRLLPGLVDALARNAARQQSRIRLFEIGKVFERREPGVGSRESADAGPDAPVETLRIAAVATGDAQAEQWAVAGRAVDFHDIKGDLESLAACAGAQLEWRPSLAPHGHPGRSADIYRDGARIGWIGELHPRLQRALDLDRAVVAFEVDLAPLQARQVPRAAAPSRFPSVRRDLAFVVADEVPWAAMEATIREAAGPLLAGLVLFDRYVGKGVESGFRSLAMGLILQEDSRTLNDREVDDVVARVIDALRNVHAAAIRG